jgi:hypothetical protein
MYKRDLLQDITDASDMRHYKGMMKNIKVVVYDKKYYPEFYKKSKKRGWWS